MIIDGKLLADEILLHLTGAVTKLKTGGITPTLAVILVGDDPGSLAYIRQKQKAAEKIGATVIFDHQPPTITPEILKGLVDKYNADPGVHGVIIQRPVPTELGDVSIILDSVAHQKDVDGFLPGSPFDVPVAAAVGETLRDVKCHVANITSEELTDDECIGWLQKQNIVIVGRGSTAGKPIADYLANRHCATSIIHSKTPDPDLMMKNADIIVSCVGRERVVTKDTIKPGVILIGVGLWRDTTGKLRGDYDEGDIIDVASFYTPTPGGIGPINVACLMQNLIKACTLNL